MLNKHACTIHNTHALTTTKSTTNIENYNWATTRKSFQCKLSDSKVLDQYKKINYDLRDCIQ